VSSPCLPAPAAHNPETGLGVASLDTVVCTLIDRAVAPSTLAVCQSGKRRYLSFCGQFSFPPLPLEERVLCRFVASLFAASLSYQSIRSYLSAVRPPSDNLWTAGSRTDFICTTGLRVERGKKSRSTQTSSSPFANNTRDTPTDPVTATLELR
jgi:hypothetical protein